MQLNEQHEKVRLNTICYHAVETLCGMRVELNYFFDCERRSICCGSLRRFWSKLNDDEVQELKDMSHAVGVLLSDLLFCLNDVDSELVAQLCDQ